MKCTKCGSQFRLQKMWYGYICGSCETDQAMEKYGLISKTK